jgi:hypothetical protein
LGVEELIVDREQHGGGERNSQTTEKALATPKQIIGEIERTQDAKNQTGNSEDVRIEHDLILFGRLCPYADLKKYLRRATLGGPSETRTRKPITSIVACVYRIAKTRKQKTVTREYGYLLNIHDFTRVPFACQGAWELW